MRLIRAAFLAFVLAAPKGLRAQTDTLSPPTPRDSADATHIAPIVVSGTRLTSAQNPRLPSHVDVFSRNATLTPSAGFADALAAQTGVSVSNDQGTAQQPTLELRGFTLSPIAGVPQGISIFLDGVRINEPDAQEVYFELVPFDAVEKTELIRGPSAVFGKNTLGGALNLTTYRGRSSEASEAEIATGSFGNRQARISVGGAKGAIDGYAMARISAEGGYQAQSSSRVDQVMANIGHSGDSSDIALSLLYGSSRVQEAGSLPESWIASTPRANFTGGDFSRPELWQVSVHGSINRGLVSARGAVFARSNEIEQFNVNVSDPNTRGFVDNKSAGATAETNSLFSLRGHTGTVTVGGEAARTNVGYRLFVEPTLTAPDLPEDCDESTGLCENARVNGAEGAVYAQTLFDLTEKLSVMASARADYVTVPFRDLREPANDGSNLFRRVSPDFGLTYRFSSTLRAYASTGSGFRAPAPLELACASETASCALPFSLGADPPLRPVVARNEELGFDWSPTRAVTLSASAFRTDVSDEIVFVSSSMAAGFFQNLSMTRRVGTETSFSAQLPHLVHLSGSFSYLATTYRAPATFASVLPDNNAVAGNTFPLSPRFRETAGADVIRVISRNTVTFSLRTTGISSQFLRGDEANRESPLGGYWLGDARIRLERGNVTLDAAVNNFLDRRYVQYGIYAANPKGPPGGPVPAQPVIERFLTPGYPRTIQIAATIR
jgi:iron complex outermembrane recepter protein